MQTQGERDQLERRVKGLLLDQDDCQDQVRQLAVCKKELLTLESVQQALRDTDQSLLSYK